MVKGTFKCCETAGKIIYFLIVTLSSVLMLCIALVSLETVPYSFIFGKTVFLLYYMLFLFFLYAIKILVSHSFNYSIIDIILFVYGFYLLWNCIYNGVLFSNRSIEIGACFLFYIILRSCQSIRSWSIIICAMLLGGVMQGMLGILQFLGLATSDNIYFIITGSFYNPGPYGGYLAGLYPIVLGIIFYKKSITNKLKAKFLESRLINYLLDIIIVILLFSIIISQSRAAWCSTIFVSIYFIIHKNGFIRKNSLINYGSTKRKIVIVLFDIISVCILVYGMIYLRTQSVEGRLYIWKITNNILDKNNFIAGVGIGKFNSIYMTQQGEYLRANPLSSFSQIADNTEYCFNELLQTFIETGIIGLIFMISVFILIFIINNRKNEEWVTIVKGGIISIVLFSFFSYPFHILPILLVLFVYLALGAFLSPLKWVSFLNKKTPHIGYYVLLIPFFFTYISIYKKINHYYEALQNWNTANIIVANRCYAESLPYYKMSYWKLRHNGYFLNDYGRALSLIGNYTKSNKIMYEATKEYITSSTYLTIGLNYDKLNNLLLAEKYYKKAYWLCPKKMYPLYLLIKLYRKHGMFQQASSLGRFVLHKNIKINSLAIKQMKEEILIILNNNQR